MITISEMQKRLGLKPSSQQRDWAGSVRVQLPKYGYPKDLQK